jgi:RNase H-fold protein (predicted Holliday junction resolvase)
MQDEAVTSKRAEAELEARGKPYQRGDIDALAATYILEDFLAGHREPAA